MENKEINRYAEWLMRRVSPVFAGSYTDEIIGYRINGGDQKILSIGEVYEYYKRPLIEKIKESSPR